MGSVDRWSPLSRSCFVIFLLFFFFFFFVFSELLLPTNTHSEGAEVAFLDHLTAGDTGQQVRRWSLSFFKSTERGGKEGKKTKVLTTTATEKRGKNQGKHTPSTHFVHDFFCSVAAEYRRYVVAPCSSLFLLAKNSASRAPSSPGEEQAPDPQRERLLARWRRLCF